VALNVARPARLAARAGVALQVRSAAAPIAAPQARYAVTVRALHGIRLQTNPAFHHKDRKAEQKRVTPFEEAKPGLESQLRQSKANEVVQHLVEASGAFIDQDFFSGSPNQKAPPSPPFP